MPDGQFRSECILCCVAARESSSDEGHCIRHRTKNEEVEDDVSEGWYPKQQGLAGDRVVILKLNDVRREDKCLIDGSCYPKESDDSHEIPQF